MSNLILHKLKLENLEIWVFLTYLFLSDIQCMDNVTTSGFFGSGTFNYYEPFPFDSLIVRQCKLLAGASKLYTSFRLWVSLFNTFESKHNNKSTTQTGTTAKKKSL